MRRWLIRGGLIVVILLAAWGLQRLMQARPLPNMVAVTIVAVVIGAAAAVLVATYLPQRK
ncbi:hypothetical protein [Lacticaseibacillus zhaodongensis]|uniref:hypothetical protein n=1 Tax=Lacticaseibacillus zhaodongensis TaxID=2668065 RepID=UPI0012D2C4D7|nr:hypothetical protein [Lacticaseibacillus zhaodongensis]